MKNLKRILSVLLILVIACSFAGCHKKGEIAVKIGDIEFTSAYYMCALVNADNEARNMVYEELTDEELNGEVEVNIYSKKVEDKKFVDWVEDTAMDYLKGIAAYKSLCAENKLEIDEETQNNNKLYIEYYWQSYASYYEANGVGKETYVQYMNDSYYSEMYFEHLYAKDGEKEINAEDVKNKIYDNFVIANILNATITSDMEESDIAIVKSQFDGYAEKLKTGKATCEEIYNEYNGVKEEDHNHEEDETEESKPKDEYATVIGAEGTTYESSDYETIKAMATGEVKVIETEDGGYTLVVKQDIKADEYYLENLDMSARHLIADEEYEKLIEDYAKKLEPEINNYAVKQFKVKKIVQPTY
ncbi:MAG: hypothetical protein IKY45_03140 [Clostridia bacterium]|nr:hypothetical protein [Clostridia bacterium]